MGSLGAVRTDAYGDRFSGGQTLAYGLRSFKCGVSCKSSRRSKLRRRESDSKLPHSQSGLRPQRGSTGNLGWKRSGENTAK